VDGREEGLRKRKVSDSSVLVVVAHSLLNSMTSIHGTVATARAAHESGALPPEELQQLLRQAEAQTARSAEVLRDLIRGLMIGE
jgi:hypothetical protein